QLADWTKRGGGPNADAIGLKQEVASTLLIFLKKQLVDVKVKKNEMKSKIELEKRKKFGAYATAFYAAPPVGMPMNLALGQLLNHLQAPDVPPAPSQNPKKALLADSLLNQFNQQKELWEDKKFHKAWEGLNKEKAAVFKKEIES